MQTENVPCASVRTATSHAWGTRDTQGLRLRDAVYVSSSKRYLASADLNDFTVRKNSLRKGEEAGQGEAVREKAEIWTANTASSLQSFGL